MERHDREAIIEATARLIAERGLTEVTMSHVAEVAGIGRATLYKYFADVQAIINAWHAGQIESHLDQLAALVAEPNEPDDQLRAVMLAYVRICAHRGRHGAELNTLLHQGPEVVRAQHRLVGLFVGLIDRAAPGGQVRRDATPEELATYCLHALTAATTLSSSGAVERLVELTLSGLRPAQAGPRRRAR